ncbi:MAG TPA: TonB family protein [Candidatus Methylacidiphilales bacterium]|nr:TonB family protein [Candidatus Methylacidiphilales bacterium]
MIRTDMLPKQRQEGGFARPAGALAASCGFHALFFGLLLWVTLYSAKWIPAKMGSPASEPAITLSTLVITAPMPLPIPRPIETPPPEAVPVLPDLKPKLAPPRPVIHHTTPNVAKTSPTKSKSAKPAPFASSYAPGNDILSHPPYPEEAQDLGETGTVVMAVTFNLAGKVTQVKVIQSSGVPLLDNYTRTFILNHWHSTTLAGQTDTQSIVYQQE